MDRLISSYCAGLHDSEPVDRCERCGRRMDGVTHPRPGTPCEDEPVQSTPTAHVWWITRPGCDRGDLGAWASEYEATCAARRYPGAVVYRKETQELAKPA